mmetsp:Transcript_8746/g.12375  ORF Transcript_8746/g.12375 Transcript_8746/m.12375 type:complete len:245 (+) Transcript_8746:42-776(+)
MTKMDLALEFNNLGVELFNSRGRLKEARQLFKGALEVMLLSTQGNHLSADFIHRLLQDNHHIRNAHRWLTARDSIMSDTEFFIGSHSTEITAYFVHLRGMKIRNEAILKYTENKKLDIFSAIVLYNVALVDHFCCLQGPDSKSKNALARLNNSKLLYNMALDLIQTEQAATDLQKALTNNLGAIYFELGDYANAAQCFGKLRSSLSDDTCQNQSNQVVIMNSDCKLDLAMNVLYLREPTLASAA